jgi:hypothetical protein
MDCPCSCLVRDMDTGKVPLVEERVEGSTIYNVIHYKLYFNDIVTSLALTSAWLQGLVDTSLVWLPTSRWKQPVRV